MITDPIADMFTRIRNAQMAFHSSVECPGSKLKRNILDVLKDNGYINDYEVLEENSKQTINVSLKYYSGKPVIAEIGKSSKPGRRIYCKSSNLPKIKNGLGIAIISTSKGIMTDYDARRLNLGGEVLGYVF
jgi:small subunit ribosomal protein S8